MTLLEEQAIVVLEKTDRAILRPRPKRLAIQ